MLRSNFDWLHDAFDRFIIAISSYVGFLQHQCDITAKNHASENPVRSIDKAVTVKIHKKNIWVAPVDKTKYNHLKNLLIDLPSWKPVDIEEYLPADPVDVSAANTTNDAKVDERVKLALELGDPDITIDLHEHRSGRSSKYDTFWKIAAQFLAGKAADVVTAVDERRHDIVVHLATAISVNDLLNQIKRECLLETPIPKCTMVTIAVLA
ncbi:hypothetical protein RclHR1_00300004 [Rhizophagus clarus]|uniref:Uncharacterized protein n=1 Tax=Rhizophagus clarus TaxID=94130 RepID=A0A2Z6R5X5_9GLOM|nr:hypothetical protein RclHR1_00300004 [Rhizophagus clarus]